MLPRIIEIENLSAAEKELFSVGSEKAGVELMTPKTVFRCVKLKGIHPAAANIIKQEMLSFGGEAAAAYGAINCSVKETDVLIAGTIKQMRQLLEKLALHQFQLPQIAKTIEQTLDNYEKVPAAVKIGKKTLDFGRRTYIMGALNVTPDSFSDGGKFFKVDDAVAQAKKMLAEGADIIDIGGESTRPGASPVSVEEEKRRILPVIEKLAKETDALISIDTQKSEVAEATLKLGAHLVNDISALHHDKNMAKVCAEFNVPVVLMHMQGTPQTMQQNPVYQDLIPELISYLTESIELAKKAGISEGRVIVDPGIGFGKTVEHNLEILKRLRELKVLGRPILIGTSRKSLMGGVLGLPVEERLEGTSATVAVSIANGADIVRVHDVKEMSRVAKMADAIVRR